MHCDIACFGLLASPPLLADFASVLGRQWSFRTESIVKRRIILSAQSVLQCLDLAPQAPKDQPFTGESFAPDIVSGISDAVEILDDGGVYIGGCKAFLR